MKVRFNLLALMLTLALPCAAATAAAAASAAPVSAKVLETKAAERDLWIGHIFWVRNVVEARLAGDASRTKIAEQQVVANAQAIAGSIEPFYGKAGSEQLFKLLAGHWQAISGYLDATRAGDKAAQDAASKQLSDNAGQIATFLSGANPNLPAPTVRGLFTAHGAHHMQQIQQLKARQYDEEAKTWSAMKDHMYVIADALAGAIAKQFPEKFS
jgi:Spy/CpxP family protein refolding chaperone